MEPTAIFFDRDQLPASRVGIGTWAIGGGWGPQPEERSLVALQEAVERGCRLIDTAPLYGNGRAERLVGRVLREQRAHVTVCTKVFPLAYQWAPAAGTPIERVFPPEHIIAQAEASLRRLRVECLDCLLMQTWCPSWSDELSWYQTMRLLQQQGKIRSFGIAVSDHRPDEANGVIEAGRVSILEVPYSLLDQRAAARLFPVAQRCGASVIARSPLASGALAGQWPEGMRFHRRDWRKRVFRGEQLQRTLRRVELLKALADPEIPLAQFALRFCLSHPAVSAVVVGVREANQARCNLAVLEQPALPQETLARIAQLWEDELRFNVRTSIGEEGEGERRSANSHLP
jgi:aryl-alcohol dehydrogenase-like predicted oxidoreductase